MENNIILNTDSYKLSHWLQYPPGTEKVVCYIESRGSNYDVDTVDSTLFFGIQGFVEEILKNPITAEDIYEAQWYFSQHGIKDWNEDAWWTILDKFDGVLPVKIRSVREGTLVPFKNVLVTIENTDPEFYWLPTYLETALLRAIWYPTTVATISHDIKRLMLRFHEEMSDEDPAGVNFKLHDFGCRGVSSYESAGIGGAAHLVNFMGTDTVPALKWIRDVYDEEVISGFSIPASEHSTMTTWGPEGEWDAIDNMIQRFGGPDTLTACVMDSYNLWEALDKISEPGVLRHKIESHGGTLVVRPDSGDPRETVIGVLKKLMNSFGFTTNSKGYKVLPPCIRVIQGDGVDRETIEEILNSMKLHRLSIDNVVFGMGGALLQRMDRDTFKFAMKCSAVKIDGQWYRVSKDPVDDPSKKSKSGYLTLCKRSTGDYYTVDCLFSNTKGPSIPGGVMGVAYENGVQVWEKDSFSDVRARANNH